MCLGRRNGGMISEKDIGVIKSGVLLVVECASLETGLRIRHDIMTRSVDINMNPLRLFPSITGEVPTAALST